MLYTYIKSLCCAPEAIIMLYVHYISIFLKKEQDWQGREKGPLLPIKEVPPNKHLSQRWAPKPLNLFSLFVFPQPQLNKRPLTEVKTALKPSWDISYSKELVLPVCVPVRRRTFTLKEVEEPRTGVGNSMLWWPDKRRLRWKPCAPPFFLHVLCYAFLFLLKHS